MAWETQEVIQSLATYFTSSKIILKSQDHLRVNLYLFKKVLGPVGAVWGNWVKNCNSQTGKQKYFKVFNCTFHIKGGFTQL